MTIFDELDQEQERGGLVFERGFWRHPVSKAPIVTLENGKRLTCSAPSSRWKNHGENTFNLQKWSERMTALGVLLLPPDRQAEILRDVDLDDPPKDLLDKFVLEAKDTAGAMLAAERGTHGHLLTELSDEGAAWLHRLTEGEDLGIDTAIQKAIVRCWNELTTRNHLEILHVEVPVVSELMAAAGTLDRIARVTKDLEFERADGSRVVIPAGTIIVLDIKTGGLTIGGYRQPKYWEGYALQILCYADGRPVRIDPEDPQLTEWATWRDEGPSLEHALIAHLDIPTALETGVVNGSLIYVDLAEARKMEDAVQGVKYARKLRLFSPIPEDGPDVQVPATEDMQTEAPPDEELDLHAEVLAWVCERIANIGADDRGRQLFLKSWPKNLPPVKDNGLPPSRVDEVTKLLDRIEAEAGMTFPPMDPRAPRSGHRSEMNEHNRNKENPNGNDG
jgi:hypothetical protein